MVFVSRLWLEMYVHFKLKQEGSCKKWQAPLFLIYAEHITSEGELESWYFFSNSRIHAKKLRVVFPSHQSISRSKRWGVFNCFCMSSRNLNFCKLPTNIKPGNTTATRRKSRILNYDIQTNLSCTTLCLLLSDPKISYLCSLMSLGQVKKSKIHHNNPAISMSPMKY